MKSLIDHFSEFLGLGGLILYVGCRLGFESGKLRLCGFRIVSFDLFVSVFLVSVAAFPGPRILCDRRFLPVNQSYDAN
jgi:hypothetical protein